jgi:hypothetical protein
MDSLLEKFITRRVNIDPQDLKETTQIYECLKVDLCYFLNTHSKFQVADFVDRGSVPEGLKVVAPNEFDLLAPVNLPISKLEVLSSDCKFMKIKNSQGRFISPFHVKREFVNTIKKFIKNVPYRISLKSASPTQGPAITITCHLCSFKKFDVDIVPIVQHHKTCLVAKNHTKAKEDAS